MIIIILIFVKDRTARCKILESVEFLECENCEM